MGTLAANGLKQTPIYQAHVELGAKLVDFAGYALPLSYTKMVEEHLQVRRAAGLFDVSHMGRLHICGPGAEAFCQAVSVNNVRRLKDGRVQYTVLCLANGGCVDDLTIFRFGQEHYELVVNASRRKQVIAWLKEQPHRDVEIEDRTEATALMALQGPQAMSLLAKKVAGELESMRPFSFVQRELFDVPVVLSRTGYTGEDGFEIECAASAALSLWQQLLNLGDGKVKPIGLAARDTLRLEMGYMLYGHELDEATTPLEAGLQWVVKLNGDDFIGKAALVKQQQEGLKRRLVGVRGGRQVIPRRGYRLYAEGSPVGEITSGSYSPTLDCGIGLAYVQKPFDQQPTLEMMVRNKPQEVDLVKPPFININR